MFGLMGYFNIKLDVAVAMLSSIMIGVGVDYTIHFLTAYHYERKIFLLMRSPCGSQGRGLFAFVSPETIHML